MKRINFALKVLAFSATFIATGDACAQAPASFEEFRKSIMSNFNSFRSRILEHYADFLAGEWHEYESLEPEMKYTEPKPETMPVMQNLEVDSADIQNKETIDVLGLFKKRDYLAGETPRKNPPLMDVLRENASSLYNISAIAAQKAAPANVTDSTGVSPVKNVETPSRGDIVTPEGFLSSYDGDIFPFYGMRFALPAVDIVAKDNVESTLDYCEQWESLVRQDLAAKLNPEILAIQKETGISDYLMFEMIMAYLDSKLPGKNTASKMSVTHYLLANMGFGVRIAVGADSTPYILLPFGENIYGRARLRLGKDYYVFSTPGDEQKKRLSISTPVLPDDSSLGKDLSLRMDGLRLPMKEFRYDVEYEGLHLAGIINENVIPMIYKYPQMKTGGFAATVISPEVREDVVRQVKSQLSGLDPLTAADKLLAMIQYSFPYATDDNFHGFEKPYFFEEILYYPKSDCEDRSVFYSYLLWNALGLETDLIAYPGHEATAIRAEKVWGGFNHYVRDGKKYYISDPTYMGAPTGQCMPNFIDVTPEIDLSYGQKTSRKTTTLDFDF